MEFCTEHGRIFAKDTDGKMLCEIVFPDSDGVAEIQHTYVSETLRGQGVANRLMEMAVQQIQERNLAAHPTCSYAVQWFYRHPEKSELLSEK